MLDERDSALFDAWSKLDEMLSPTRPAALSISSKPETILLIESNPEDASNSKLPAKLKSSAVPIEDLKL